MSEDVKGFLEELKEYSNGGVSGLYPPEEVVKEFLNYIEQLQEENEEINNILYSPEKRFTNCPKCGEKDLINYSREVYILEDKINKAFQIATDIKSQIKLCLDELEEKRERGEISYRDIEDIRYIYEDVEKLVLSLEEGEE